MDLAPVGLTNLEIILDELSKHPLVPIWTPEGKELLACVMYALPQVEDKVFHSFAPGIYIREAHYPTAALVVGEDHVGEHITELLQGSANLFLEDGTVQTVHAPYRFVANKGRKLGYMLTDCIWQNIFATTETDIEVLERTLVNPSKSKEEYKRKQLWHSQQSLQS